MERSRLALANKSGTRHIAKVGGICHQQIARSPNGAAVRVASQASFGGPCHKPKGIGTSGELPPIVGTSSEPQERVPVRTDPQAAKGLADRSPQLARALFQKRHAKADSRTPASPVKGYVHPHVSTDGEAPDVPEHRLAGFVSGRRSHAFLKLSPPFQGHLEERARAAWNEQHRARARFKRAQGRTRGRDEAGN